MADNVLVTAGSGTTIAADEVVDGTLGTVKVQYVKLMDGTLDGTTKAAVGANGLKVDALSKVTDGTNTAAVKAASTAPAATDPALVVAISPNSVNANGQALMASSAPVVIASNQSTIPVQSLPATSGGLSRSRTLIPNNTTAVVVKASAGQVYKIRATNNSATIAYIKLYDATSATAGVGTPVDTIMIPAATAGGAGIADLYGDIGVPHTTGITFIVTTGIADNDTTAPSASAYVVTVLYK
jgi:hypothetical protein